MPSITVAAPYPGAAEAFMDQVLLQTVYRTLSFVPIPFPITDGHKAAEWLVANGRGGTLTWKLPGRVFMWTKCRMVPSLGASSPTEDLWVVGGIKNTVLFRRWFWVQNLPVGGGQLLARLGLKV